MAIRCLYTQMDEERLYCDLPENINVFENAYESDCSRLLHSPCFRRIQGKTQLFPGQESDFFRNRLTHSLEVERIAQLVARKLKSDNSILDLNPAIIRFACLAHDLGHPPFGHDGEKKLNEKMKIHGGFEGNAQTLHILTNLEKGLINNKERAVMSGRMGLNITYRSLASILKRNSVIPEILPNDNQEVPKIVKGYYKSDIEIVKKIHESLGFTIEEIKNEDIKTIECQIMDYADDISNAVHDLDDSLKGNFLSPFDLFFTDEIVLNNISEELYSRLVKVISMGSTKQKDEKIVKLDNYFKGIIGDYRQTREDRQNFEPHQCRYFDVKKGTVKKELIYYALAEIFKETTLINVGVTKNDFIAIMSGVYRGTRKLSSDSFERTRFIKGLTNKYIDGLTIKEINENLALSEIEFKPEIFLQIELLKLFHSNFQHKSTNTQLNAFRGGYLVERIFDTLTENPKLMPKDFYSLIGKNNKWRVICDFIAGMTNLYCTEFYGRLFTLTPESYFKPV